jgi:hypothetical protein
MSHNHLIENLSTILYMEAIKSSCENSHDDYQKQSFKHISVQILLLEVFVSSD